MICYYSLVIRAAIIGSFCIFSVPGAWSQEPVVKYRITEHVESFETDKDVEFMCSVVGTSDSFHIEVDSLEFEVYGEPIPLLSQIDDRMFFFDVRWNDNTQLYEVVRRDSGIVKMNLAEILFDDYLKYLLLTSPNSSPLPLSFQGRDDVEEQFVLSETQFKHLYNLRHDLLEKGFIEEAMSDPDAEMHNDTVSIVVEDGTIMISGRIVKNGQVTFNPETERLESLSLTEFLPPLFMKSKEFDPEGNMRINYSLTIERIVEPSK